MARKPNYDFEKRRKEQERKAKQDAKRADRQARRDEQRPDEGGSDESTTTDVAPESTAG